MKVAINPEYILKKDVGRALLLTKEPLRTKGMNVETVIHPIHAMILSFFNGIELTEGIEKAAAYLHMPYEKVENFVMKVFENPKSIRINLTDQAGVFFPPHTLVRVADYPSYKADDFRYEKLNIRLDRHQTPSRLTFMATTKCATDCIYCYANREAPAETISLDRMREVVREAKQLGVFSFEVIGGEFFLYPHWKELLEELHANGYDPYISTKVPISESIVESLKNLGVHDLQISLDTLLEKHIGTILNVHYDYCQKIKETFRWLAKHNIEVRIHTILTNLNDSLEDMQSIYEFIKDMPNISVWKIDVAASTLYKAKDRFPNIKIGQENLDILIAYFDDLKTKRTNFKIVSGNLSGKKHRNPDELTEEEKNKFYTPFKNIFCAANYSSLFILPDGKVTICEELYWKERFIIGDLKKQTIEEIWNSKKAVDLYYISKTCIREQSPCKSCDLFEKCRYEYGGVCWKEIIKAYGDENWDYPDPNCPKAIKVTKNIYV